MVTEQVAFRRRFPGADEPGVDVVVVAVYDGFHGCVTGAGRSNRALLETLGDVLPAEVALAVLAAQVRVDDPRFQPGWRDEVEHTLRRSNRQLDIVALDDDGGRWGTYGAPADFGQLGDAVAAELARLRRRYRRGLVVLCDLPFATAASESQLDDAWPTVLVPRTSTALICPSNDSAVDRECTLLGNAVRAGVRIAAISGYMSGLLATTLGVPASSIVDLPNGISSSDLAWDTAGAAELVRAARGRFWLAMGRAVPEKGFEELIDALCLLKADGVRMPHVVLAAVSEAHAPTPYQCKLQDRVARERLDMSVVTEFSPAVRGLLKHPMVAGVVVPSRVEPFGRIPLEAYAAGVAPVVATRAGGLAELVVDGMSGFTAAPGSPYSLAAALQRAATIDAAAVYRMRQQGRKILARFDYRNSVVGFLRQVAPWLAPSREGQQRGVGLRRSPRRRVGMSVLQVPEVCGWNPYVAAAESALVRAGVRVRRPGLCHDTPGLSSSLPIRSLEVDATTVVHLHWPEKLARELGTDVAASVLRDLVAQGATLVQTVHNVGPHEPTPELADYLALVDELTVGVHFFSPDHEAAARRVRPGLPNAVLRLPHPQFFLQTSAAASVPRGSVGCFGRLRGYKRTARFARTYLQADSEQGRLLIAGNADDKKIHRELVELAEIHPRFDYRPGFATEDEFWALLGTVEWVALPYRQLYSSGILVAALQLGRRIISAKPTGGVDLYGTGLDRDRWVTIDPWDDDRAVTALIDAHPLGDTDSSVVPLSLPSWTEAAEALTGFYCSLSDVLAAAGGDVLRQEGAPQ